jgi:hypothetical protein
MTWTSLSLGSLRGEPFRLVIGTVHLELVGEVGKTVHYVVRHNIGSGAGIRTLNLAVNRSLQRVQIPGSEFAECR